MSDETTMFEGPEGKASLLELFEDGGDAPDPAR
jgi:predicted dithiol-disulfide oxidoreductase (DUF899 family)